MEENIELDLSNIQKAHAEFYENNFFDVKIYCKSIILPAHRYVLSCRSELLAQKLASGVDTLGKFEIRPFMSCHWECVPLLHTWFYIRLG